MARITIIANPAAGTAGDRSPLDELQDRLRAAGHDVRVEQTDGPGHARHLASRAAASSDVIVAAGGDGTLNEVVNGLAAITDGLARCRLGLLPVGTGNDFARSLDMEAPADAITAIVAAQERRVDLVQMGDRVFLNASAGGFTAETSSHVSSDLKQVVGKFAYLLGGARAFLEYEPVRARIVSGDRVVDTDLQLFAVCNGAYIGGGHQLAPTAVPDDGQMEVCLVRASSSFDFLSLLPRLSTGEHVDDEDVSYFRASEATFTFARPIKVNTDGEVLEATACHYRVLPRAVRMLAPGPASRID